MINTQNSKILLKMGRYDEDEISNLGFVRPFSNSERLSLACSRNYTLEYIEGFSTERINENFLYGSCWHLLLEKILLMSMDNDEMPSLQTVKEWILKNLMKEVIEPCLGEYPIDSVSKAEISRMKNSVNERIYYTIEGWLENWNKHIHPFYKVIDVERLVYAPVKFNNQIFKSKVRVIKERYLSDKKEFTYKNVYRQLRSGEYNFACDLPEDCILSEMYELEMPYYKIGRIDALLLHRESNSLWVLDHKTTKSPSMYEKKTQFDLQLSGYCSLLREQIKEGKFDHIEGAKVYVGGVIWDIVSSDITSAKIPKPLKSGKFSKSESKCPPSWLLKKALNDHGVDFDEYEEFYNVCKQKDSRFFIIKEVFVSNSEINRLQAEDYAIAKNISQLQNNVEEVDWDVDGDWDYRSPRYSICTNYASCKYSSNCFANSKTNDIYLKRQQKLSWIEYEH